MVFHMFKNLGGKLNMLSRDLEDLLKRRRRGKGKDRERGRRTRRPKAKKHKEKHPKAHHNKIA